MKKIIVFILTVVTLVSLCACSKNGNVATGSSGGTTSDGLTEAAQTNGYAKEGEMKMRIFKIGKDNAILVRTSSSVILFDAGQDEKDATKIINYMTEKGLTKIDQLIITCYDSSSIGGIPTLLESVEIGSVTEPDYEKDSEAYKAYSEALASKGLKTQKLTENKKMTVDDITIELFRSTLTTYTEDIDGAYCIVSEIKHGNNSFYLCGCASDERLEAMLNEGVKEHDFLVVPDYGMFDVHTEAFLTAVKPAYAAIIDSAKHNADPKTLTVLAALKAEILKTSDGNIKVTSDKENIKTEQGSSTES